jgi:hypothetical protein
VVDTPSNLHSISGPLVDPAVVETLEELLSAAQRGEVTAIAAIVAYRSGAWSNRVAGDTTYHNLAGLNLRVDMMKRLLLQQVRTVEELGG